MTISSLFTIKKINFFTIEKKNIARMFFYLGILISYWGTLMPWFIWKIEKVFFILSAVLIAMSMLISRNLSCPIFKRTDFQIPILSYLVLNIMICIVNGGNVNAYIALVFYMIIFLSLFMVSIDELKRLIKFLCMVMGTLLSVSIFFFVLYVLGVPLPSSPIAHETLMYSFTNYYFFLIDDRSFLILLPRFQSVFMEPGHLGTASVLLLLTQLGKWKKWYNVVLLIATLISFSLAAFVLLAIVLFINAWLKRKRILPKILLVVGILTSTTIVAIFYNDGDNMLNTLIIERLEIDDGKLAGDNRVTDTFEAEFGWGNAGYRVYIYDNGIIVLMLTIFFYIAAVYSSNDRRAVISMFIIGVASFWVRATPLSFYYFIPLYAFAYIGHQNLVLNNIEIEKEK